MDMKQVAIYARSSVALAELLKQVEELWMEGYRLHLDEKDLSTWPRIKANGTRLSAYFYKHDGSKVLEKEFEPEKNDGGVPVEKTELEKLVESTSSRKELVDLINERNLAVTYPKRCSFDKLKSIVLEWLSNSGKGE